MFKCNSCNRSFKTRQALGGHVSRAHLNGSVSTTDSPLEPVLKEETMVTQPVPTLKEETIVQQPAMTETVVTAPSKEEMTAAQPVVTETTAPALIPAEANEANTVPAGVPQETGEIPTSKAEEEEVTQSEQIQRYLKQGFTLRQLTDKLGLRAKR